MRCLPGGAFGLFYVFVWSCCAYSIAAFNLFSQSERDNFVQRHIVDSNSISEVEEVPEKTERSSNLGCFLCAQVLAVTKQRVGLSQNQLRLVLNDKCHQIPPVFRAQCFTFIDDSLPQIYVSLAYDMPIRNICEMLKLCDPDSPFVNERLIAENIKEAQKSTTANVKPSKPPIPADTTRPVSKAVPYKMTSTTRFPAVQNILTSPSPFEERRRPYPVIPSMEKIEPKVMTTTTPEPVPSTQPTSTVSIIETYVENYQIPDFKELANKVSSSLPETETTVTNTTADAEKSKRLTCLFCERMLNNAKSYAISAKSEISAFANATCARIAEAEVAEQCFQLTDRKINELAVFVDEQVVEALWCAQLNRC
uniref:Saposin B-type domain-containing protein n=1 Tax=Panagrellus redivivus TaxID=6233 RepID=A0A7E5A1A6_PANRE